jgi:hypothetical protein
VSVLSEKIKREIEEKGVVPDSQTGFIWLKAYRKRKEGRMCGLFVDFRAAFDKVDTEKMFECMRERERERERERNKPMAGAESRGGIRENKKQSKGGRKRR